MHRETSARSTRKIGSRALLLGALGAAAVIVPALTAGAASANETTWLCKPGIVSDPCERSEETTVVQGNGSTSVEQSQPASNPPVDCFYVYPTVSGQKTPNANLDIESVEQQVAIDQASRFSQDCKVYAPMYEQLTLYALEHPEDVSFETRAKAYVGVLAAFNEYLARYNDGRGFVLIGHSQGALMLKQLIEEQIDPNPSLRAQLVSAVLLGGNVLVPKGRIVGGNFKHIPACQAAAETHCVVAYSSFLKEPPNPSDFGRVESPLLGRAEPEQLANDEVLCVNPTLSVQSEVAGALLRYESTTLLSGEAAPFAPTPWTPWVSMPGQYTAKCEHANGATWLQLDYVGPQGDARERLTEEILGPQWGTHVYDVNVALGNLVGMTGLQAATYEAEQTPPAPPLPPPPTPTPAPTPEPPPATFSSLPPASSGAVKPAARHHAVSHKKPARRGKRSKHTVKHKASRPKHPARGHKAPAHSHKKPAR